MRSCLGLAANAALGAAAVFAFAPFSIWGLNLVLFAAAFVLWRQAPTSAAAAWRGFAFGLGYFGAGVHWLFIALHVYGGMPAVLALLAVALFCAYLALFPALAAYLLARCAGRSAAYALLLAAPAAWCLTEWLRGWLFSGFPWLALGYAELPSSPLLGFAPVLGVYGLSLLVCFGAGALAYAIVAGDATPAGRRLGPFAGFVVLLAAGGLLRDVEWSRPIGEPVKVSLLQGNITQDLKFDIRAFQHTLETYLRLARDSEAKLIITPESAVPAVFEDTPPLFLELLEAHAQRQGGDVLLGVFTQDPITQAFHNSVLSFGVSPTQAYYKVHLVPFGERIPLKPIFGWIFEHLVSIPIDDQGQGSTRQKPLQVAGQKVAVNICYEDAFGEEIIRQLPEATLLVNMTNDAWYGRSIAARQHNQIAQMRSLETARVMLRATNTGVTSVIDERGQIVASLAEFTTGRLDATIMGRSGSTPFVSWGNWPAVMLVFGALGIAAWRAKRS